MQTTSLKGTHLSQQQNRLWRLQQGSTRALCCAVLIEGSIDIAILVAALQQLSDQHEILRTRFYHMPEMALPIQIVNERVSVSCPLLNLETLTPAEQQEWLQTYQQEDAAYEINPASGTVLSARLVYLQPGLYRLFLTISALCADRATFPHLINELVQHYQHGMGEAKHTSEDEPLQYADVAAWLDELVEEDADGRRATWQSIDIEETQKLPLPFQQQAAPDFTFYLNASWKGQQAIDLQAAQIEQLVKQAAQMGITPQALLLTCWQALLWHLTGTSKIMAGVVCDGRHYDELTTIPGLYSRTVPLATHFLNKNYTFAHMATQVHENLLNTLRWQEYFTWPASEVYDQPYMPVSYIHEEWPEQWRVQGQRWCLQEIYGETEPFALQLQVRQQGSALSLVLQYETGYLQEWQAQQLATALQQVIQTSIQEPETLLGDLHMLSNDEQERLLKRGCGPQRNWSWQPWHRHIQQWAQRTPQAPAVVSGGVRLTYEVLEQRTRQVAIALQQRGIAANSPVVLCFPRGVEQLVGLLGILRAGGTYAPVEGDHPDERILGIVQQVQPEIILTQQAWCERFASWPGVVLSLETIETQVQTQETDAWQAGESEPDDLAALIFTSGSTGRPKGVEVTQRGMWNYAHGIIERLDLQPGWHYASVTTLAADLGNTVLLAALQTGGCLHLLDYETVTSVQRLQTYMQQETIAVLKMVPSHLAALLEAGGGRDLLPQKALVLGGERFTWNLLRAIQACDGACAVYNHYGPTETTVGVLVHRVGQAQEWDEAWWEQQDSESVPLGEPLPNSEISLRNEQGQRIVQGVQGELWIAGAGVARGYRGQPVETAQRFVQQEGQRWYRTGDRVCYTEHGRLEYQGRGDGQVKIRGYRVELAEVERELQQVEGVKESLVLTRENERGELELVGYVVQRGEEISSNALKHQLRERVPDYMVPARIVRIKAWPLNSNGKLDRQRLREYGTEIEEDEHKDVENQISHPIEELLCGIWQEVLGASRHIARDDNFFALGGHSLLATQVVARIKTVFGIEIAIAALFEAPTIEALAQRIEQVLQGESGVEIPELLPVARDRALPLSFAQQRLWFLHQLEPDNVSYNKSIIIHLSGVLDINVLKDSLDKIVQRHEVLRTTFAVMNEQPVQIIHTRFALKVPYVSISDIQDEERERVVLELAHQDALRPFRLAQGPLMRVQLLHIQKDEFVLLLTMHHIVSDAWSNDVCIRELSITYNALLANKAVPLPALPIQYADYAAWQRQWLQGEVLERQIGYWSERLQNVSVLELPTDRPRPVVQSYRGAHLSRMLPRALTQELKALSQQEGVTLFMTLVAAFQVVLARYSGQTDISVGTPIANRTRAEIEDLIGFFVNTLVLRTDLAGNPSFLMVLRQVRERALEAYAHQDVPFEKLVEVLQPERDMRRAPLFQVMIGLQQPIDNSYSLQGLILRGEAVESAATKFDITMALTERVEGLHCRVEYSTDLFEVATIERLLAHFQRLLEVIVIEPEQAISQLPILPEHEEELLVAQWSGVEVPRLSARHWLEDVALQAQEHGDVVALCDGEQQISYQAAEQRANQLARWLQGRGVGRETLVGVCLSRSVAWPLVVLAIAKAGAGFLPLDSTLPAERLRFQLQDAGVHLLISQQAISETLPADLTDVELLILETLHEELATCSSDALDLSWHEEQIAYQIYTSGSTGQPKGVQVPVRGLANLGQEQSQRAGVQPGVTLLQFASPSFDAAVSELLMSLVAGGTLYLAERAEILPGPDLIEVLQREAIGVLTVPPSALQVLPQVPLPHLHTLFVAGEACPAELVARWGAGRHLYNAYGPTEATVCATMQRCEPQREGRPPIGMPLGQVQVYVLDEQMQPTPIGVPGEIYLGGIGLARGYGRQPEQTAECFVPHPFSLEPGARLYRTGDRGRWLAHGELEYQGRGDGQIKLRGYRIELGEIEAILSQQTGVHQCAVVVHEITPTDQRLVGYIVPTPSLVDPTPDHGVGARWSEAEQARASLQQRLPEYMIPSQLIVLAELPTQPSGKIDRRALAQWSLVEKDRVQDDTERREQEALTPVEELLSGIWAEVLDLESVGVEENFFELGGHSLLVTQVMGRVEAVLGVLVPVRELFEAPMVRAFAQRVEQARQQRSGMQIPPLVPVSREQKLPLSFAQQRLWFLQQLEPASIAYSIPLVVHLQGSLHYRALQWSFDQLIQRHESLRTVFAFVQETPLQIVLPTRMLPLRFVDCSSLASAQKDYALKILMEQDHTRSFDLARGPLLRVTICRISDHEHMLLLTMHHIISDAISNSILVRELSTFYRSYVTETPLQVEKLGIQYADYAAWQRQWLQGEVLERQIGYWSERLQNVSVLELPTDHPRPAVQSYRGAHLSRMLPRALTQELKTLSQQEGVTLFMTLVAAFQVVLARYSGQTDISVGTPIANRTRAEIEDLIGFFVNTLVLRTDLAGNPSFLAVLRQVRERALEAYAHQDVPFEKLVEVLQPERDMRRAPLFQVMIGLQLMSSNLYTLHELTLQNIEVENATTKFDITMALTERVEGLHCRVEYSTDLFEAATIERLLEHFQRILEAIVVEPEQTISQLPILPEREEELLLAQWSGVQAPRLPARHWLEEVALQVQEHADVVALRDGEQQISYQAVERRANQLARWLQGCGVGRETLVGVCLSRSVTWPLVVLAIAKAGAGFLPLDSTLPVERLRFQVQDAGVHLLLTEFALRERLPADLPNVEILSLETLDEEWVTCSSDALNLMWHEEQVAYQIYTSGSTGQPKGVQVPVRGLANLGREQSQRAEVQPGVTLLQFASPSFDAAISEVLMSLVAGGTLYLAERAEILPGPDLIEVLQREAIGVLTLPPSALQVLPVVPLPHLHTLLVAGEACSAELVARWSPGRHLYNAYGPTEATVCATMQRCEPQREGRPPIGTPLDQVQVYVLDEQMQPAPIGVPGELYLGGIGLARGYGQQPEQTAQRFVPHPFSPEPGARLYRTGDRGRWLAHGELEYQGRGDGQIKLRGYRIELGEIEAILSQQSGVQQCAVVVHEITPTDQRLVGYIVPTPTPTDATPHGVGAKWSGAEQARASLQYRLPEYMIPSHLIVLAELPTQPSGKIDRRALAQRPLVEKDRVQGDTERREQEALTPVEELLSGIWAEVLDLESVGVQENFFELGGHSLLVTQVMGRVEAVLGVLVPVRELFEAPTVRAFAQRVEQARQQRSGMQIPPLVPVSREQKLPLSFAQQRLWFLQQLEPESTAYHIPLAAWVGGALNHRALAESVNALARRHEILRTSFRIEEETPWQKIAPATVCTIPVVDLSALEDAIGETIALHLAREEMVQRFDLEKGPLWRVMLLRVESQRHLLVLTMHHIISDGISNGLLLHEISQTYSDLVLHENVPVAELAVQYADYAMWQRNWLQGEVLEQQLRYWQERLEAVSVLELRTDYPRPAVQTYRGASVSLLLPAMMRDELKALSQQEGVTLFMLLVAAFQVLLARYSGQNDISIGTPVANRTRGELEELIGFFVNTLVLRTDLSDDPDFLSVLQQVREVALGAYAHQDIPFEKLVEVLQPERDMSRTPLFQVMVSWQQEAPVVPEQLVDLRMQAVEIETWQAKFDLALSLTETADGLRCHLEYNCDLFMAARMERLLRHFERLLGEIIATPERRFSQLALLTGKEQQQLITWGEQAASVQVTQFISHYFMEQVRRQPDALALVCEEHSYTYGQVQERVQVIARELKRLGISAEVPVGVLLERSAEVLFSLLAIFQVGGIYVPLDPQMPVERLRFILDQLEQPLLIVTTKMTQLSVPSYPRMLVLEELTERQPAGDMPDEVWHKEQLAYIIYTSGTTGTPKGVAVSHEALVAHCQAMVTEYQVCENDHVLQFSSHAFDVSLEQLLIPLVAGACLVMRGPQVWSGETFLAQMSELAITVADVPTAYWHQMTTDWIQHAQILSALRLLIVGGERMQPADLRAWMSSSWHHLPLYNAYGPTETTITATLIQAQTVAATSLREVPIGRALPGRRLYVLDQLGAPTPVGVPGELFIGGALLARCYLGLPDQTALSFVPDPFSREPGGRLYRTGDLVCWREDGLLEFIGRRDHQVKVRGYRIELSEIEGQLRKYDGVREAMVVAEEFQPGEFELVAYIVTKDGQSLDSQQLRTWLSARVPGYMVPRYLVWLAELPLTLTGKIDRRALPAPILDALLHEEVHEQSLVEEIVRGIWSEVLGQEKIGRHANFFALGGHSLLATRMVARIKQRLQVALPLRALFENPTIEQSASCIETLLRERVVGQKELPLLPVSHDHPLPLSFAQQRLWFLQQLEPASVAYTMPSAVWLDGEVQISALRASLQMLVERHEILRTTFHVYGEIPMQVVAAAAPIEVPLIDLSALALSERESVMFQLAAQERGQGFALQRGPLMRVHILRQEPSRHLLVLTIHHIVSDGVSSELFVREVSQFYRSQLSGEAATLPDLPIQYADYAVWQRNWLQGEVLEQQANYWTRQLAEAAVLQFPTDYPRPSVQTFRGAYLSRQFPSELCNALSSLSRQQGVTLFILLVAAFQVVLARYSGQDDISVGTPVANRTRTEIEHLIGFFINTLVLRTNLTGDPTFEQVLERVREVALGAYTHQDIPFEKVVEVVQPERDLSLSPLFQVMIGLQQENRSDENQDHVTFRSMPIDSGTSKFDMTLTIAESTQGLLCGVEYSTDLFEAATIERLLEHFQRLLEAIVVEPEQTISQLPILPEREEELLLAQWSGVQAPRLPARHWLEEVALQVHAHADVVALRDGEQQISYQAAEQRANQLAHWLQGCGVGRETLVGVCLSRSVIWPLVVLAIAKAGAGFLPLDSTLPAERLRFQVQDAGVHLLFTEFALRERLPADLPNVEILSLETLDAELVTCSSDALNLPWQQEQIAYQIYTSGSTGQPKGVQVPVRGLANLGREQSRRAEVQPGVTLLQFASPSFDAAISEVLMSLVAGGTLYLAERAEILPGPDLIEVLQREAIGVLTLPPSALQVLPVVPLPHLHTLLVAGEACPAELVTRWSPDRHLYNAYGPTEATVCATMQRCESQRQGRPPIGTPLDQVQVYVLDEQMQPVPIGVPGELYLGGIGLARGYGRQPEQTAQRFVPHPFSPEPGARLYRTGDRGRWLAHGELEYQGRGDGQIKLRGYRIELGEIEVDLTRFWTVEEEKFTTESKYPSIRIDRSIATKKRLWRYHLYKEGMLPFEPRREWKEGY